MTKSLETEATPSTEKTTPNPSQRERNQLYINQTQYNYLYIVGSDVFHRRDCKICLNASSHTRINGSVYYHTAVRGRRPCKICKPVPGLLTSFPDKKRISTRLLTGQAVHIERGQILGWCKYHLHPGAVTKSILKEHNCLEKKCPYLEQNSQSQFWPCYYGQIRSEAKRKEKKRNNKRRKSQEKRKLEMLTDRWKTLLAETDSDLLIIRISRCLPGTFIIFYVSDNRFNDADRYPEFLDTLKCLHPDYSFILRHIKDVDGHFVTKEEYRNRRKK